ncbi:MAG: hypothetical protein VB092_00890 [Oscillospiraceae bacterium]|nr:hypothetical protein [Oscillospiraceae bacterium]
MSNCMKNKKLYFAIPVIAIVLAVLLAFTLGFAKDRYNDGSTTYTGDIDSSVDIASVDVSALYEDVKAALGQSAEVFAGYDYSRYTNTLTITVTKGASIDGQAVIDMLSEKYADLGVTALNARTADGSYGAPFYYAALVIVAIVALVGFLVSLFVCGALPALWLLFCSLGAGGFITLVYILARVTDMRLLVFCVALSLAGVFGFGSARVLTLNRTLAAMKKATPEEAANAVCEKSDGAFLTMLILAFLFSAAFAAAGFISGGLLFAYIGLLIFALALALAFTNARLLPAIFASKK